MMDNPTMKATKLKVTNKAPQVKTNTLTPKALQRVGLFAA
jgi:hypothetical protein